VTESSVGTGDQAETSKLDISVPQTARIWDYLPGAVERKP